MAFVYRDPFEELQRELESMLGATFAPAAQSPGLAPPVNVFDAGEAYVVKAEVPGLQPEQLEISVEEETLTLRGGRTFSVTEHAAYHRRERGEGKFRRVVRLPSRIASADAKAQYRDGVLTVTIPKAKEARPRRVDVQAA
jgi:HSP20 family protein